MDSPISPPAGTSMPPVPTHADAEPDRLRRAVTRAAAAAARARLVGVQNAVVRVRAAELLELTEAARRETQASREALREAVCAYASALRADGARPERMLVAVKQAVGADSAPVRPGSEAANGARTVMDDAVRWSIEAYFTAPA